MTDIITLKVHQFNKEYGKLRDVEEELEQRILDVEIYLRQLQKELSKVQHTLDKMEREATREGCLK